MAAAVPYRPLGLIKELLESHGLFVTHCYEDLVFIEGNAFLLQMGEKGDDVSLVFNTGCGGDKREEIEQLLIPTGLNLGMKIGAKGSYSLTQNEEDSTISIAFLQETLPP